MPLVHYYNRAFSCDEDQTVLDVLLENGQDIPYSCKMGVCITCVLQTDSDDLPARAQEGLRESLSEQGHFLPCVCQPTSDIRVTNIEQQDLYSPAVVLDIEQLSKDTCRVFLGPTTPLYYHAGQFVNLRREDGLVRSYSLASVPTADTRLEFHIKRLERGQMSNWILDKLKPGDHLGIQGPFGNCFYEPGHADQNMLLIGNGTGLAPLIGIARDALQSGHTAPIRLYHGSQTLAGLYLDDELRALESGHINFKYIPCVSPEDNPAGFSQGRADDVAFQELTDLLGWRVFLCGYPPMVHSAQERALTAGAQMTDIYTDPYELKELRKEPRT
ncbi:MAG: 2Fe-2S iron-sulfur cluster binding domain-containing protein [Rhodospirillaceae bacterium]|jgi:NAD(P)H-flavin reductase/ferredoxin|nr:2Fe-2S iron-sulfur cluster binding domain-containing protein [Rhodospirillaceae bacterium]MBT7268728.1 2Fe-2S iron-sulfur cluster binding domain-containing protein [Rhodospirillaceae bacterium]